MYKILPIVGYIPENQHGYQKWWFGNSPLQYVSRHINFQELFCPTKGVGGKCYDQWVMQRRRWFGKGDSFKIQKSMLDFWGVPINWDHFLYRIASIGSVVRERDDSCGDFWKTEVGPVDDYSTLQTLDLPKCPSVWGVVRVSWWG